MALQERATTHRRTELAPAVRHKIDVALMAALAAAAYAVLGLVKLRTFRATTFDLVIFDQAVRGYAGFGPPTVPAVGVYRGLGLDALQLADHFSPILAVLAPLYWLHDGPVTLILAQSLLLAAAIPPLWLFTRAKLGTTAAYLVVVAYASSGAVAQAAGFDFHEVAFVPILTAVTIERFERGKAWHGALAAAALLLVKEDMGLLVAGFGCYLLATRRWRYGAGFVAGGVGAIALIRYILTPAVGGDPATHWTFNHLGTSVTGLVKTMVTDPGLVLSTLIDPDVKVDTMLGLAGPLAVACLLSPLILPAVPLILERMLSDRPFWWTDDYQYNAFIIVIVICAAVDGAARFQRWVQKRNGGEGRTVGLVWAAAVCGMSLALTPQNYFGQLVEPSFYRGDQATIEAARAAVDVVPDGALVEVANRLGPALTSRATVLLWEPRPHGAPWVVADTGNISYPFGSVEDQQKRVLDLKHAGYRIVHEEGSYVVLHRLGR
ncbi:DUF2079 domain-containing protein [Actinopolymorpha sp. B17G11]|uniref:DUF2079 domain-containing protein n=1 Tax=Actinopolymorpha sp. B17G11 TaxID=3160861 RepID=UPI0032E3FBED